MKNRLGTLHGFGVGGSNAAAGSGARLGVLFLLLLLPLGMVGIRAAWLQTAGRERYLAVWERTSERLEPIPARDGRILSADGQVLAFDETRYELTVHYRWLESPPDEAWLKRQTLSRLSSTDRKDPEKQASARREVLHQRDEMHRHLAALLECPTDDLQRRFQEIQRRVEGIVTAVEKRREARDAAELANDLAAEPSDDAGGWRDVWQSVVQELTTPPKRPVREPLIVAEELEYHTIARQVPVTSIATLRSFPSRFPGVDVRAVNRRVYPQGSVASHVIGARTPLRDEEFQTRREKFPDGDPLAYQPGDRIGRSGIELAYEPTLRGIAGIRKKLVNRQGEVLREEVVRPPREGRDVVLSIDARFQKQAEDLLDAIVERGEMPHGDGQELLADGDPQSAPLPSGGCLVAIDVRTGQVLAAASSPRHDARLMVEATSEEWKAAADDPRRPFFPRVTQAMLPPGSVFKTISAVALLESPGFDPEEPFHCQGYLNRPDRERCYLFRHFQVGHGDITLDEALSQSCNVYFYDAARRLGAAPLVTWAQRFGFGEATGADLPGEKRGQVPTPQNPGTADGRWYPGTTRQLAIGQAALTVTPLQVARMMAAIANDGWLLTPRFTLPSHELSSRDGQPDSANPIQLVGFQQTVDETAPPPQRIEGLSRETLAHVRRGLQLTVEHPRGTGRTARLEELSIAGKTGTAEVGGKAVDHAWFAGYAPADSPRVAFVVVIENGGSGGAVAAPVAREFLRTLTEAGMLPRQRQ